MKRVYIAQDGDGHNYVIPFELKEKFNEKINEIDMAQSDSDEERWYDAIEEFTEEFGIYATDGDINNFELFAHI